MTVSVVVEAVLRTTENVNGSSRTAVGIAPSSADVLADEMRVMIDGAMILRAFDPGGSVVTGAPIDYVTVGGEPLVTMAGEQYVLVVEP